MEITPPVIIAEGLDVSIFASIADALSYLEPIDVEDNVYIAFDSTGRPLRLTTDGKTIQIQTLEGESHSKLSLANLLTDFLVALGNAKEDLKSKSLKDLLQLSEKEYSARKNRTFLETIKHFIRRLIGKPSDRAN